MYKINDVVRWTDGWGYTIDPPMYVVVSATGETSQGRWFEAIIADRGGSNQYTAIEGKVHWTVVSDWDAVGRDIVPPDEVPDHIWPKIALAQMFGGEKPCDVTTVPDAVTVARGDNEETN